MECIDKKKVIHGVRVSVGVLAGEDRFADDAVHVDGDLRARIHPGDVVPDVLL